MGLIAVSAVARRGMESEDWRSRMELAHASRWPRLATRAPAQSPTHPRLPGWGQPGSHEPSWSSSPRAKPTQVRQKTGGVQSVGGGTATMPPAAVDAGRLRLNNRKGQVRCTLARAKPWSPLRNCGGEAGSPRWRFGDSCQCITSRGVACPGRKPELLGQHNHSVSASS